MDSVEPRRKRDAAGQRIAELLRTVKELKSSKQECETQLAAVQLQNEALEEAVKRLQGELEARSVDYGEYRRLRKLESDLLTLQKRAWSRFEQQCAKARTVYADFDRCYGVASGLPQNLFVAIADLPNAADVIVFIGRSRDFLKYLGDLTENAAIQRIKQTGLRLTAEEVMRSRNGSTATTTH